MYDVIIIGGGVIGCGILRELSRYNLKTLLLERNDDVSCGASRANSGIVHAGYDCKPGTLKARFNVEGNKMYPSLVKELDVPFEPVGSIVAAREGGMEGLKKLKEYGDKNGVKTEIINRDRILEIEPNVTDEIKYALYAPTAGIVSPYKLTIAFADQAILNGAEIKVNSEVVLISRNDAEGIYTVSVKGGESYKCRILINAAGTNSMKINELAGAETYPTEFRRGEYFVLDPTERVNIHTVIFPLPDENGKGILVAPTADGNVLYGPTSILTDSPDDNDVSMMGLEQVRQGVVRIFKAVNFRKVIRVFAGLRSGSGDDFVIKKSEQIPNYIMLLGICSPGLSSAPAIAKYVAEELVGSILQVKIKSEFEPLPEHLKFTELTISELDKLIKEDSRWGRLICRCEKVSEAEIVRAIHSPLPATSVDAVKRRTRAGMGRCQGGFCAPRVMEIIARELNIPITEVRLKNFGSELAIGEIKE
jgi:glycerol-3-phosphate dehydrogenase